LIHRAISAVTAALFVWLVSYAARASGLAAPFSVPVSLVDGYVIVDVRVNGEGPFHFMFDTGADIVVLDPAAEKLALHVRNWGDGVGDGEQKVHWRHAEVRDLQLGEFHFTDRDVGVLPTDDVRQAFGTYPLSGFIGTPLLDGMVVKLDYVHRQLTVSPADQFAYSGSGTVLPLVRRHVLANIDGLQQYLFVDTGTKPGITLGAATSAQYDLPAKYAASAQSITDWGAGGLVRTRLAHGHVMELGSIELRDPLLYLSMQKAGALASTDGRIGAGILSRFDVTFDTSRSRIILEKNANFGLPEPRDRLGMWIDQAEGHLTVGDVVAGGPADAVGVRPGDTILEIDGARTETLVLPFLREQLEHRSAGDRVKLLLQSGEKQRAVVVTLRDRV
jgi:hypothetical protein